MLTLRKVSRFQRGKLRNIVSADRCIPHIDQLYLECFIYSIENTKKNVLLEFVFRKYNAVSFMLTISLMIFRL